MLQPGDPAPAFALACEDGAVIDSATLAGRPDVLYLYPKDSTPGCTQETCDFRDRTDQIRAAGAEVFGVSRDTVGSHARFHAKQGLNFHLLSDPDRALHLAYGCWGKKVMYGKEIEGTIRSTFLIGADGRVAAAWPKVRVAGHAEAVLAAVLAVSAR